MYPNSFNTLSLGKIISGISKTLNLVNQAIPLYKQVKPIINNAGSILTIFKEFNKNDNSISNSNQKNTSLTTSSSKTNYSPKNNSITNTLTFFQ